MFLASLWNVPAVRFVTAGAVGFGTYCVLLYVLTEYAGWWYLASSVSALIVNYSITFVLQKLFTFGDRTSHVIWQQMGSYALMVSGFYISNVILLYILVDGFGMWYMFAQAVISILLTVVSFFRSRLLFAPKPPAAT